MFRQAGTERNVHLIGFDDKMCGMRAHQHEYLIREMTLAGPWQMSKRDWDSVATPSIQASREAFQRKRFKGGANAENSRVADVYPRSISSSLRICVKFSVFTGDGIASRVSRVASRFLQ